MDISFARADVPGPRGALFGIVAALLFACGDGGGRPVGQPVGEGPPVPAAPPPEEATAFEGIELPPFELLPLSPPELAPPMLTPPAERPVPAPAAGARPPETVAPSPEETPPAASLEDLLRIPNRAAAPPVARPEIAVGRDAPAGTAARPSEPGALERIGRSVRVERRSEPIGPKGPRQGTRSETDAGIRVPLDEEVSLEGGVRVDQRDEPGQPEAERKSTPRVGVEVRF